MDATTAQYWAALAQAASTVVTGIGVIVSLHFSRKALSEIAIDRRLRYKPHLLFTPGGCGLPVEFVRAGRHVPGINPKYAMKVFSEIPDEAESVRIAWGPPDVPSAEPAPSKGMSIARRSKRRSSPDYAHLWNHGTGPALNTRTVWIAQEVSIGSEKFRLDEHKLREPVYTRGLNDMPVVPWNIAAGKEGHLTRLPTFIEKDFERKLTCVQGILETRCNDIFGDEHTFYQEFTIFPEYSDADPSVHVTFGEVAAPSADQLSS